MMFESVIRSRRVREAIRCGPLGPHMDGFVTAAAGMGYTKGSLHDLVLGASWFARYVSASGITDVRELRDHHVRDFIRALAVFRDGTSHVTASTRGRRGARHLLHYLRTNGIVPPEPVATSAYAWVLDEWLAVLREHRGLTAQSVALCRRQVEPFLQDLEAEAQPHRLAALSPTRVREYLQRHAPCFARVTRKNLVVTLRGFLRYAFRAGYLHRDVASSIERVPCFTLDRLPRGPKREDLPQLLTSVDRSTALGRRDFAILLTLLTYGVRAGQLTRLRLEDVHWREGRITFPPAKQGRAIDVPLTPAVGNALVHYLRAGRPASTARQVFLSSDPPFRPLAASSVYNVVARAFRVAGIASPHRGSHAIRHAWATRVFAQGHGLKTVADLLGHRRLDSTRIYAKVDYPQLRSVGLPWPEEVRS
jgi:integrase/recombinase XerD